MPEKPMDISIKRIKGSRASMMLKIAWSPKTMPKEKQDQMWRGIGMALAAVMTPEEAREFLDKLERAKTEPV